MLPISIQNIAYVTALRHALMQAALFKHQRLSEMAMANGERADEEKLESTDDKPKKSSFSVKDILNLPTENPTTNSQEEKMSSSHEDDEDEPDNNSNNKQLVKGEIVDNKESKRSDPISPPSGNTSPHRQSLQDLKNGAAVFNGSMTPEFPHPIELQRFGKYSSFH